MIRRNDDTQKNFEKFLSNIDESFIYLYGFEADGAQVITTDQKLYKTLLIKEAQRKKERNADYKISVLNTLQYSIPANAEARGWWKNSLFAEQASCTEGLSEREFGGNVVCVLTTNKERLEDFVEPIVERHMDEFGIEIETYPRSNDVRIPYLQVATTVDNKKLSDEFYATKAQIARCATELLTSIKGASDEETNERK